MSVRFPPALAGSVQQVSTPERPAAPAVERPAPPARVERPALAPNPRINVVYLTTLAELAGDELVGQRVVDPENGVDYGRRTGTLESLVRDLGDPASPLSSQFNLVGVIFDDDPELVARLQAEDRPWPWDMPVPTASGKSVTLSSLCRNVPSRPWRQIKGDPAEKARAKALYEHRMVGYFKRMRADLVVSDSYTCIAGPTLLDYFGTSGGAPLGRALNVHPAIAAVGDPRRLPGLTPTRDACTRARHGYIIVDDKRAVDLPEGERITVDFQGQTRQAVKVPRTLETGVTVHVLAPRVDNGKPVAVEVAPLPEDVTQEGIRVINYGLKRGALARALSAYVQEPEVRRLIDSRRRRSHWAPLPKTI